MCQPLVPSEFSAIVDDISLHFPTDRTNASLPPTTVKLLSTKRKHSRETSLRKHAVRVRGKGVMR
jgi:hypothetical protein